MALSTIYSNFVFEMHRFAIYRDIASNSQLQLRATLAEASRGLSKNYEAVICMA